MGIYLKQNFTAQPCFVSPEIFLPRSSRGQQQTQKRLSGCHSGGGRGGQGGVGGVGGVGGGEAKDPQPHKNPLKLATPAATLIERHKGTH